MGRHKLRWLDARRGSMNTETGPLFLERIFPENHSPDSLIHVVELGHCCRWLDDFRVRTATKNSRAGRTAIARDSLQRESRDKGRHALKEIQEQPRPEIRVGIPDSLVGSGILIALS